MNDYVIREIVSQSLHAGHVHFHWRVVEMATYSGQGLVDTVYHFDAWVQNPWKMDFAVVTKEDMPLWRTELENGVAEWINDRQENMLRLWEFLKPQEVE